jgi:anti-sigma factor RsiW
MSLCQSIDTLSMAYLDDELATEERRELELHLIDCTTCRQQVDTERSDLAFVRGALVPPPATDILKSKLGRMLDTEDAEDARRDRKRWSSWVLPGGAMVAAAAALALFIGVHPAAKREVSAATHEAVRQQLRQPPLEVQGASTGPWMREHFAPVAVPQFTQPGVQLVGGRLSAVDGHDAALLFYALRTSDGNRFGLTALVVRDVHGEELSAGQAIDVGGRTLHLVDADGVPAVTFVDSGPDGNRLGYVFTSDRLSINELVDVVVSSDLIRRAQQGR